MNVQAFLDAGAVIQIHIISAILALCIGLIVFLNQKGTPFHIRLGKTWLGLMIVVSLTGLFIHEIRTWGLFSPIHMFSFVVPISLTLAIYYARKGRIADHKRTMTSVFVGSNLIAGGFAFLPGRLEPRHLFGESRNSGCRYRLTYGAASVCWRCRFSDYLHLISTSWARGTKKAA